MHELAVFAKWEWLPTRPHTISDKHILAAQHACRKLLNGERLLLLGLVEWPLVWAVLEGVPSYLCSACHKLQSCTAFTLVPLL